ncbi:MAG: hypothetical protein CMG75_02595 [Candidatus Marinimicrobia bacterium]|nr:hypothetical protein [Candidatus Neomarinimicrobiota bacterium]|tara:strand:- start:872 stop:1327 length:456 start_codon:yes stop_codon:yes gene_type:complete
MDIILTAAVTINGMIAREEMEYVNWSADLSLFREQTIQQTVVMGSITYKTLKKNLENRTIIVMHRDMDAKTVLSKVNSERCFIIGGARTYSLFAPFLTHIFITPHPLVFKSNSIPLFSHLNNDLDLSFIQKIPVDEEKGIFQLQYKIVKHT